MQTDPLSLECATGMASGCSSSPAVQEAIDTSSAFEWSTPIPFVDLHLARALMFAGRPSEALPGRRRGKRSRACNLDGSRVCPGRPPRGSRRTAAAHYHPFRLAVIDAALGDNDRAFEALDRAAVIGAASCGVPLRAPEMAALRGDPRFDAVPRKLGLP